MTISYSGCRPKGFCSGFVFLGCFFFINVNKHSWVLCPLTIIFLVCFILIGAVRLAACSLALLHWTTGTCLFSLFLSHSFYYLFKLSMHFHHEKFKLLNPSLSSYGVDGVNPQVYNCHRCLSVFYSLKTPFTKS